MPVRTISAVVLGGALWFFLFMAVGICFGFVWPAYAEAVSLLFDSGDSSLFTLPMYFINMIVFLAAGLGAGTLAAWVGKRPLPTLVLGGVALVLFGIDHYILVWDNLPHWYNLIIPWVIAGTLLAGGRLIGPLTPKAAH